jgi:hypothetical protein
MQDMAAHDMLAADVVVVWHLRQHVRAGNQGLRPGLGVRRILGEMIIADSVMARPVPCGIAKLR